MSVNPITKEYSELTPYQFASNPPIQAIELDGFEAFYLRGTWSDPNTFSKLSVSTINEITEMKQVLNLVGPDITQIKQEE